MICSLTSNSIHRENINIEIDNQKESIDKQFQDAFQKLDYEKIYALLEKGANPNQCISISIETIAKQCLFKKYAEGKISELTDWKSEHADNFINREIKEFLSKFNGNTNIELSVGAIAYLIRDPELLKGLVDCGLKYDDQHSLFSELGRYQDTLFLVEYDDSNNIQSFQEIKRTRNLKQMTKLENFESLKLEEFIDIYQFSLFQVEEKYGKLLEDLKSGRKKIEIITKKDPIIGKLPTYFNVKSPSVADDTTIDLILQLVRAGESINHLVKFIKHRDSVALSNAQELAYLKEEPLEDEEEVVNFFKALKFRNSNDYRNYTHSPLKEAYLIQKDLIGLFA